MKSDLLFGEILKAVEEMSLDEQETSTDIIRRRIIERRRRQLINMPNRSSRRATVKL